MSEKKLIFQTTHQYWDCACETNYIHSRADLFCRRCMSVINTSPDSRVNEVKKANLPMYEYYEIETHQEPTQ